MDHSVISHTAHSSLSSQVMDGHNGQKPWMEVMYRVDQKIEFFGYLGMGLEVLFVGSVVHRLIIVVFLQTLASCH